MLHGETAFFVGPFELNWSDYDRPRDSVWLQIKNVQRKCGWESQQHWKMNSHFIFTVDLLFVSIICFDVLWFIWSILTAIISIKSTRIAYSDAWRSSKSFNLILILRHLWKFMTIITQTPIKKWLGGGCAFQLTGN